MKESIRLPGGEGIALSLEPDECVRVINVEGSQVVDMWAFRRPELTVHLSTEHTRSCLENLCPGPGDWFYSNLRAPLVQLIEDSSPGVHDLLLSACDQERYRLLGHSGWHANCAENFHQAVQTVGTVARLPSPVNLFENVAIGENGGLEIRPPPARPGDYVTLRSPFPILLVLSACPMDIALTNGPDRRTRPIDIERWLPDPS